MLIGTIGEKRFTFLNLYAQNEDCPLFFKKIVSRLADEGEGIIMVEGGGGIQLCAKFQYGLITYRKGTSN